MPDKPDPVSTNPRGDDPDAPPSEEELAQARALREALEDPRRPSDEADLARALQAAWAPRDLAADEHRAIVRSALARADGARRRGRVVRVSFGASAVLALAAAAALVVWTGRRPPSAGVAALAVSRSTQPLFSDKFAPSGGETSRIDRIAMARAVDLRDNEFAKWGVR
jgi:hypothetical protein